MKDLGNKLLLFVICTSFLYHSDLTPLALTALTTAMSVSSLCTFFHGSKIPACLLWAYLPISLIFPPFAAYLPLISYDACQTRQRPLLLSVLAAEFFYFTSQSSFIIFACFATTICAILLCHYTCLLDSLQHKLHRTMDDSREFALTLRERNQALIRKQDSEIRIATLSERNRIARSIHDNVGHLLTRSILQTGALMVINQEPALDTPLTTLHDTLNTAMTSIRESVHDLHDESIDLYTAVNDIVKDITAPAIELEYDMGDAVVRGVKYAFIAIIKEAVNNMQKHSNATSAYILLREHPGFYHLHIRDNGSAASLPPPGYDSGIGLANMTERVHALGGTIDFSTEEGFQISITIVKKEFPIYESTDY